MVRPLFTETHSPVEGFAERMAIQIAYEKAARKGKEEYSSASGNYNGDEITSRPNDTGYHGRRPWPSNDPRFVGNFLANRIDRLLGTASRPVVALDIGAEFGITWHWLASLFAGAIDNGDLALGVTNLAPSLSKHRGFLWDEQPEVEKAAREAAGGRVQFIDSNARSLPDKTIKLQGRAPVSLRGRASIVHQRRSVAYWSHTPGLDIVRSSETTSPDGIYMVPKIDCVYPYLPHMPDAADRIRTAQRKSEVDIAHAYLGQVGLTEAACVETGQYAGQALTYHIFKGPQAPHITV